MRLAQSRVGYYEIALHILMNVVSSLPIPYLRSQLGHASRVPPLFRTY